MTKTLPATAMHSRGADYKRMRHHLDLDPAFTLEDVLRPNFWAHHVNGLSPKDIVEVLAEDFSIDLTLRVIEKGVGFVKMRPMWWDRQHDEFFKARFAEGDAEAAQAKADGGDELPDGYIVNHVPAHKWRVITKNPQQIVSKGHTTRADAVAAAHEHAAQALGRAA